MEPKERKKRKKSQDTDDRVSVRSPPMDLQSQLGIPSTKIKLQLFPLNDLTQIGLVKEGHNPYLELTLSARKRISSVVNHINSKWHTSSVAKGQLVLFPYSIKLQDVGSCTRWTSADTMITTWEVYVDVGSPSVFRLRYGWYFVPEACGSPQPNPLDLQYFSEVRRTGCSKVRETTKRQHKNNEVFESIRKRACSDEACSSNTNKENIEMRNDVTAGTCVPWDEIFNGMSIGGLLSEISLDLKINNQSDPNKTTGEQPIGVTSDVSIGGFFSSLMGNKTSDPPETEPSPQPIFLVPSDISVGGLLSEVSLLSSKMLGQGTGAGQTRDDNNLTTCLFSKDVGGCNNIENKSTPHLQDDNLVVTHMKNQSLPQTSHIMSILDAEETCHAFPVNRRC